MRPRVEPTSELGRKIDAALGKKRSVKWLAGELAKLSKQPITNTQSYVWRWWKTEGITDEWAEYLSTALGQPRDHFKQEGQGTPRLRPIDLLEERVAVLENLVASLKAGDGDA